MAGRPTYETFAAWLRARGDVELRDLLTARPDLIHPVPADLTALADRAGTSGSVVRALDRLNLFELQVIEALVVLPEPVNDEQLRTALGIETGNARSSSAVDSALDRLRALALVYCDGAGYAEDAGDGPSRSRPALHLLPAVRRTIANPAGFGPTAAEAFRDYPARRLALLLADMGHPAADAAIDQGAARAMLAGLLSDPVRLDELLADAGLDAVEALQRLSWGPAEGRVGGARRAVRIATAGSPIERLLARGLLAASGEQSVVLPREVALHLRGSRVFRSVDPDPPPLDAQERDPALVDRTAGGQAFATTRAVEKLLDQWGVDPPGVLRAGGLGVRDLRRAARALDVEEWSAALYVEVALAAGLLASSGAVDGEWLPTKQFDLWRTRPAQQQWAALAAAWLTTTRVPGLVGERDERDKTRNALGVELNSVHGARLRAETLAVLAEAPKGAAVDAGAVRARLDWRHPRRSGPLAARMVDWTLREAEVLGVTGLGALSTPGRLLVAGEGDGIVGSAEHSGGGYDAAADALEPLLPQVVNHVLVQADLTAVAPGPLTQDLAAELALVADVESTGGATVYRFTEASVRRALDAGRTADELNEFLERHSRTPVPQPLRYQVTDVARRHGRIRVGTASAYLRCDDPAMLNELLADRRAASLRLFRLAPTVVASRASRGVLLDGLRSLGYAPVAESPDGAIVVSRPDARRSDARREHPTAVNGTPAADPSVVAAAVRALRAGETAARSGDVSRGGERADGDPPPRTSTAAAMEALRRAVVDGQRVWIGYLDTQGRSSSRIVDPVRVEGGFLTAFDTTRASVHRFALHRISGVAAVDAANSPD